MSYYFFALRRTSFAHMQGKSVTHMYIYFPISIPKLWLFGHLGCDFSDFHQFYSPNKTVLVISIHCNCRITSQLIRKQDFIVFNLKTFLQFLLGMHMVCSIFALLLSLVLAFFAPLLKNICNSERRRVQMRKNANDFFNVIEGRCRSRNERFTRR